MENKYDLLEERIRTQLGREIFKKADLPLSIEGNPLYDGTLNLETYRKYFPRSDNEITVYLTLLKDEYSQIRPELTNLLRQVLNSELFFIKVRSEEKEEDHTKSKEMAHKLADGYKKLIEIIEKEFPK